MGNTAISGLAALIALAFIAIAVVGCSTPEQITAEPANIAPIPAAEPGTPEFHGARIGNDALRSRVPSEG
ncbi:MAG: hypothetical protein K2P70_16370 [Hyphomonadaceae bacterium]|nr:hypothetical protein [Hyphomonadaceae bacterium]